MAQNIRYQLILSFLKKSKKYHQKQKCSNEILIKNILFGIYICKVNTGNARTTSKSIQSFTKNQTDRCQLTRRRQPALKFEQINWLRFQFSYVDLEQVLTFFYESDIIHHSYSNSRTLPELKLPNYLTDELSKSLTFKGLVQKSYYKRTMNCSN